MRIAAEPSRMTKSPDPLRPWRRTFASSANHCPPKTSTTCSRCGVDRSANSAKPAMVSASSSTAKSGLSHYLIVDKAIDPVLAGLEGPHDRVIVGAGVLASVAILRVVATADVTASHAQADVHPVVAGGQALLATVGGPRTHVPHRT